jgi:hypothetical protein
LDQVLDISGNSFVEDIFSFICSIFCAKTIGYLD